MYLKEKQESPWGSRIKKRKGKKWKGERMGVCECVCRGIFRMEARLRQRTKHKERRDEY